MVEDLTISYGFRARFRSVGGIAGANLGAAQWDRATKTCASLMYIARLEMIRGRLRNLAGVTSFVVINVLAVLHS